MLIKSKNILIKASNKGQIKIGKIQMKELGELSYLGGYISKDGMTEKESSLRNV